MSIPQNKTALKIFMEFLRAKDHEKNLKIVYKGMYFTELELNILNNKVYFAIKQDTCQISDFFYTEKNKTHQLSMYDIRDAIQKVYKKSN
jgi:hypothetical protein